MADNNESTMKWKVDVADLKAGMQDAKRAVSLANAEFKNATAGIGRWQTSITGVEAKIKQLNTTANSQKTVLQSLEKQYAIVSKEMGEDSAEAQRLAIQIQNQQAAVKRTESQIASYGDKLSELKAEQVAAQTPMAQLNKTIDKQQQQLEALKKQYANSIVGNNPKEAQKLASEIDKLSSELSENKGKLSEAEKAADALDNSLKDVDGGAKTASGGLSTMKVALGNLIADGIQRAVSAMKDFVAGTIEVGAAFDKSMSNVAALSGASADEIAMLRDTAKEYGASTQFSATQAADALGYMALAGWDANTSAGALGGVLNLAASANMDLAKASDMVTDYMSAFSLEAEKSGYFADVLAYAQSHANTTAEGLGEAFKNCAANMNAAGQDFETTTSLLSMMANQGFKGSEAGTALTAIMRDLTAKMSDGAIKIGETSVAVMDANGNYRDLTDILADVEAATNGMGDAERAAALSSTFTADSIKGVNLIMNAGVSEAADFEEQLRNSSGAAEEMAQIMNDNLSGDLTAMGSKLEGVQIALYEKFEPALRAGVDVLSGFIDGLNFLVDHSNEVIAALLAMAAAVGAYFAYTTIMKVMQEGWQALTIVTKAQAAAQAILNAVMSANPIGIVVAAIAALVAAFIYLWNTSEEFRAFWVSLWESIKIAVQPVIDAVVNWFVNAWASIQGAWGAAASWFSGIWESIKTAFSSVASWFGGIFSEAWNNIVNAFSGFVGFFQGLWNSISSTFSALGTNIGNAISGAVRAGINGVIGAIERTINSAIGLINGAIGLINKLPGVSVGTVSTLSLPRLARGAVLNSARAVIAGEDGAEAIVPLERNKQWIAKVAADMLQALNTESLKNSVAGAGIGGGLGGASIVQFNQNNYSPQALSRLDIYRDTKSLLFSAKVGLNHV